MRSKRGSLLVIDNCWNIRDLEVRQIKLSKNGQNYPLSTASSRVCEVFDAMEIHE